MNITCLASDYALIERDGIYYAYNKIYEEDEKLILASAMLGLFIPEASDYYIPICIEIKKMNSDVVITKELAVKGNCNYRYFIAAHQYKKWEKIYLIIKMMLYIISVTIDVFFAYIFIQSDFYFFMGIALVFLLFLTVGVILKLEINNKKRKQLEIVEVAFEKS